MDENATRKISVEKFWEENARILKKKNRLLYERICTHKFESAGEISETPTVPTLRLGFPNGQYKFAYNPPDPIADVRTKLPILKNENDLNKTIGVFVGMGLGYGQLEVLEKRQDLFKMVILEPCLDLLFLAMTHVDLSPLLRSEKVHILAGDIDWEKFHTIVSDQKFGVHFIISAYAPLFSWKPDLYTDTKNKAAAWSTKAISAVGVFTQFGDRLFKNRIANLCLFRQSKPADVLKDAFKSKPAILISAGPSLGESIEHLKQAKGKAVLIAVDSALVPLQNYGITPDIVTTLDFRKLNSEKLSPDLIRSQNFSLVASIESSSLSAKRLAPRHLFFSFQENDTQKWLMKALKIRHTMEPVDSVALLSLGVAQMIGADPIVLVGHDFALTASETDHATGAVFTHNWHKNPDDMAVPGVNGGTVRTLRFLLEFKQSFEAMIPQKDGHYINATAAGAFIEGTEVKDLGTVIRELMTQPVDAQGIIQEAVNQSDPIEAIRLIKAAQKEIGIAEKTLKKVGNIITQNRKLADAIKKKKTLLSKPGQSIQRHRDIQVQLDKLKKVQTRFTPYMPTEELFTPNLYQANSIKETEKPQSLFEMLDRDSRAVELEMEGHRQGLKLFISSVKRLAAYLKTEARILNLQNQGKAGEKDLLELAQLYLDHQDSAKACKLLEYRLAELPDSSNAMPLLGEAYAGLLNFGAAFDAWEKAEQKEPALKETIDRIRTKLARYWAVRSEAEPVIWEKCLRRSGGLDNSRKFLTGIDPSLWARSQTRIEQLTKTGQIREAKDLLEIWEPAQEDMPEWYFYSAKAVYAEDRTAQALEKMKKALTEIGEQTPPAPWLAFLARLLMETDAFDQGIEQLEKAVALDPAEAVLWEELGDTFFEAGDYESAAASYEKCYAALPDRLTSLCRFGDCCRLQGQDEAAEKVYRMVLEKAPGHQGAQEGLATLRH